MKTVHIKDTDGFFRVLDHIAAKQTDRAALVAARDKELQVIQENHDAAIANLDEDMSEHLKAAEDFASAYRDELLPAGVKSASSTLADWGFRAGNPTLKLLPKWKWDRVLATLKDKAMSRFIRVKEEPDKDALKAELDAAALKAIGLQVTQSESFWVEAKVESGERVSTPAA